MAHRIIQQALTAGFAIGLAATLAACGTGGAAPATTANGSAEANPSGDIPDNQAYVKYTDPAGLYAIALPEGWARSTSGGAVAFSDKLNTVRITSASGPQPTVQTAAATVLKAPIGTAPGKASVTTAERKAGPVVLVSYRSDAPADTVTNRAVRDDVQSYLFWRNGTLVRIDLAAPVGADNVDPWRMITDSFTWSTR